MYLGGYKELISATIAILEEYGTVNQDKNIFLLKTKNIVNIFSRDLLLTIAILIRF